MSSHLKWTSAFYRELVRNGVSHAVISPGSRSTPLTLAAAIHPAMKKQVVLDERSAGFIALGIGKATGRPAVLICTSGTAAGNYMPAVMEAKESGVPIIILTADRPPHLRGIGSSQTADQIKLFGDQAVFFHEAGEPAYSGQDLKRLGYLARQAVEESVMKGGAAHINFPFRKPLEPSDEELDAEAEKNLAEMLQEHPDEASTPSGYRSEITLTGELQSLLTTARRPLIIAGPANPHHSLHDEILQVARLLEAPVIAEPGSGVDPNHQTIHRYEQFLRDEEALDQMRPDLLIRFGDQPFTKSLFVALDEWSETPLIHFTARQGWQDHAMSARHRVLLHRTGRLNLSGIAPAGSDQWLNRWKTADAESEKLMGRALSDSKLLTDGHVFKKLSESLPADWNTMLSNSFIPRDMALFGKPAAGQFVNRGVAGIDGITSTAVGIATGLQKPVCCITGDLAFLHDSNALLTASQSDTPFLIAVINNGGGTIFRMLPISRNKKHFDPYFTTPQQADIEQIASAYGIPYQKISNLGQLAKFDPASVRGAFIAEFVTDADEAMAIRKNLWGR
jgi:2-succinyl-5-enolpyruvyl-6-hydroxy-3-cyclohexene-1-carboxylate synthase